MDLRKILSLILLACLVSTLFPALVAKAETTAKVKKVGATVESDYYTVTVESYGFSKLVNKKVSSPNLIEYYRYWQGAKKGEPWPSIGSVFQASTVTWYEYDNAVIAVTNGTSGTPPVQYTITATFPNAPVILIHQDLYIPEEISMDHLCIFDMVLWDKGYNKWSYMNTTYGLKQGGFVPDWYQFLRTYPCGKEWADVSNGSSGIGLYFIGASNPAQGDLIPSDIAWWWYTARASATELIEDVFWTTIWIGTPPVERIKMKGHYTFDYAIILNAGDWKKTAYSVALITEGKDIVIQTIKSKLEASTAEIKKGYEDQITKLNKDINTLSGQISSLNSQVTQLKSNLGDVTTMQNVLMGTTVLFLITTVIAYVMLKRKKV